MARLGALAICVESLVMVGRSVSIRPASRDLPGANVEVTRETSSVERGAGRWAIRVDGWDIAIDRAEVTPLFRYHPPQAVREVPRPRPRRHSGGECSSPYDDLFARHAGQHGLDWRFVLAVAFQESGFRASVEGGGGAYGLMQITPIAAREVGELAYDSPELNVRTGVRYLARLSKLYRAAPRRDRLALTLAAYNVGPGHVEDAQELAEDIGFDPNRWEGGVLEVLPLLEEPAFYSRLPGGFARGRRAVRYVGEVLARYDRCRVAAGASRDVDRR